MSRGFFLPQDQIQSIRYTICEPTVCVSLKHTSGIRAMGFSKANLSSGDKFDTKHGKHIALKRAIRAIRDRMNSKNNGRHMPRRLRG